MQNIIAGNQMGYVYTTFFIIFSDFSISECLYGNKRPNFCDLIITRDCYDAQNESDCCRTCNEIVNLSNPGKSFFSCFGYFHLACLNYCPFFLIFLSHQLCLCVFLCMNHGVLFNVTTALYNCYTGGVP